MPGFSLRIEPAIDACPCGTFFNPFFNRHLQLHGNCGRARYHQWPSIMGWWTAVYRIRALSFRFHAIQSPAIRFLG